MSQSKMSLKMRFFFLVPLFLAVLSGCYNEKVDKQIEKRSLEVAQGVEDAKGRNLPRKSYDPLVVSDRVWVGNSAVRLKRGIPLPSKFENQKGVAIIASTPLSLAEIAEMITNQTALSVRLGSGLEDPSFSGTMSAATPSLGAAMAGADPAASAVPSASAIDAGGGSSAQKMVIAYEGSLSSLLDRVAAYFNISWRYDGAAVLFSRYETRVFTIEALPGTQKITDTVAGESSGGSSGGSGGGSTGVTQSAESTAEFKVWEEISQTLTTIMGGVGTMSVAPSGGTITVTTTPEVMQSVAKYIAEENRRLSQEIAINIDVYLVTLEDGKEFGTEFTSALRRLSASYASATAQTVSFQDASNTYDGGALTASIWNGDATAVIQALSYINNLTRVAQFPMVTLNNRSVSRRIGRDYAYIKSIESSTTTADGSSETTYTITPDTVHLGAALQVTPRILDDGRIMLQYSLSMVDMKDNQPRSFTTPDGSSRVELPDLLTRAFVQQSLLKNGSSLVIGGYDNEETSSSSHGVGSAYNYVLGGGMRSGIDRTTMVFVITPHIVDVPRMKVD